MQMMSISEKFISLVKLLFGSVSVVVNLDKRPGNNCKIERCIRQGCPLALYLFFSIGEILTHIIKKSVIVES